MMNNKWESGTSWEKVVVVCERPEQSLSKHISLKIPEIPQNRIAWNSLAMSGGVTQAAPASSHKRMTHLVDEPRAVDIAYLDFNQAFNTVSYSILIDKLIKCRLARRWERAYSLTICRHHELGRSGHNDVTVQIVWLNRLEKMANRNLKKFNKGNCKVLHLMMKPPMQQ
ncbi:hypothetical protein WISP_18304 [Willisornis vidua]|uniref:Reverse transcriptase domain-containing protein n=1 Tax=Willisornis vidua TaxID=1566151 RepID=A0ABQ9DTN3_9PASS|nr:hypothetical protein WISP_18304 [Willisornis vidua]